jgi:predicted RNA-binding Zn-ribbon protein involved in translation (DUF1610 family)
MTEQKMVECETCHARMAIPPGYEQVEGKCPKCGGVVNRQNKPAAREPQPAQAQPGLTGANAGLDLLSELGGADLNLNVDLGLDKSPFAMGEQEATLDAAGGLESAGLKLDMNFDLGLGGSAFSSSAEENEKKKKQQAEEKERARKERFSPRRILRLPWRDMAIAVLIWGPVGAMVLGTIMSIIGVVIGSVFAQVLSKYMENFDGIKFGILFGVPTGLCFGILWGIIRTLRLSSLASFFLGASLGATITIIHQIIETIAIAPPDAPIMLSAIVGGAAAGTFGMIAGMFTTADDDW